MSDTTLVDGDRERTRTRQEVETEVDEGDGEHTTKIRHYETEVRELYCEHCNDWHPDEEMVPVGIDVEPGEDAEEYEMMCLYHASAFFGYEPDAEEAVYQPIVDEVDHWTWREMVTAVAMPVGTILAAVVTVTLLAPMISTIGESATALMEAVALQPIRLLAAAPGAGTSIFGDIMVPIWLGVGALWLLSKFNPNQ